MDTKSANIASVEEILKHLDNVWEDFEKEFIRNPRMVPAELCDLIKVNPRQIAEAVKHAVVDMSKMTFLQFTENGQPDRHKYAGFVSKWIAKIRPISFEDHPDFDVEIYKINAYFAFWVFRSYLFHSVPQYLIDEMVYTFHFRDERGEVLAFMAFSCERISKLEEQVETLGEKIETLEKD